MAERTSKTQQRRGTRREGGRGAARSKSPVGRRLPRNVRQSRTGARAQVQNEPKPPYPRQGLPKPGVEADMELRPRYKAPAYKAAGKLDGKVALITGGDSGIGRAVAVLYAREGADVIITYLPQEEVDAHETRKAVEAEGHECMLLEGDLADPEFCRRCIDETIKEFGQIDILVSNAAHQNRKESLEMVSEGEWDRTFKTNIYALFHLAKAAIPRMKPGSSIIVSSSQTGLFGSKMLLDYSATKGAINAFVKALAQNLVDKGIRVNAVAPGPVWTPLNPADKGMSPEQITEFGKQTPMKRAAQPEEIAPAYVFLASEADSSFMTGVILPALGGEPTSS